MNPTFPATARWIVERCLAKRPENRYASTGYSADDLRDVRDHFSEVTTGMRTSAIRKWVASPRVRRRGFIGATVVLTLFGLLAVPAVNDFLRSTFGFSRIPDEKRVAVMPIECLGGTEDYRDSCKGMLDFIVSKLGEQDRFQGSGGISVVPAVDIRQGGQLTVDAVRKRFDAGLAIAVTSTGTSGRVTYAVSVIDTALHSRLSRPREPDRGRGHPARQNREGNRRVARPRDDRRCAGGAAGRRHQLGRSGLALRTGVAVSADPGRRSALERQDQERSLEQAIELFTRAIEIDPGFAYAHASLAEAYLRLFRLNRNLEYFKLAEAHCQRALKLDELVGQAWQTLGNIHTGQALAAPTKP